MQFRTKNCKISGKKQRIIIECL